MEQGKLRHGQYYYIIISVFMTTLKKLISIPLAAVLVVGAGATAGYAALVGAQTTDKAGAFADMRGPHIHGTISAISGSAITVTDKDGTAYTVDASNAKVKTFVEGSAPADAGISSLAVGDEVGVHGTVSGTSVTATAIMKGDFRGGMRGGPGKHGVMGEVTSVNGSTITVTGRNGTTYTVEAGSASVKRMVEGSVSDIQVGDTIGVEGEVSGSTVTAKQIMDDLPEPPTAQ